VPNPEYVEIVKQGAEAIRAWREKNSDVILDLRMANLRDANLRRAPIGSAMSRSSHRRIRGRGLSFAKRQCAPGRSTTGEIDIARAFNLWEAVGELVAQASLPALSPKNPARMQAIRRIRRSSV